MALSREKPRDEAPSFSSRDGTVAAALARLYWMLAGNFVASFLAFGIALHGHGLSWRDLAYAAAVASLVAVRFVDVTRLGGTTADGDPATRSDWRRYSTVLLLIGGGVWIVAHGVAFVLGR